MKTYFQCAEGLCYDYRMPDLLNAYVLEFFDENIKGATSTPLYGLISEFPKVMFYANYP
jgi:hypothetical protein